MTEVPRDLPYREPEPEAEPPPRSEGRRWSTSLVLGALTFVSMLYAGAGMHGVDAADLPSLVMGWDFAVPLLTILVCHELGHYVVGRIRGVDISPPYFIPLPIGMLGTMGAVIAMRGRIKTRDALFDVGAAGPYAGLLVALPVLVYGIVTSPVTPLPEDAGSYVLEGRSLLYAGLLYALKGPIPEGHDIYLSPTAFAGWAGLMVTMMNLLPVGQLDGGHVGYALLGERHHRLGRWVLFSLPVVSLLTGAFYGVRAMLEGYPASAVQGEWLAGLHWLVWFLVLMIIALVAVPPPEAEDGASLASRLWLWASTLLDRVLVGHRHPPTDDGALSPGRRAIAWATLLLFVLLFMPSWIREPPQRSVPAAEAAEVSTS